MRQLKQRVHTTEGGLSACLASILEIEWHESPAPDGSADRHRWREWLAARNLQLVSTTETPQGFWIAEIGSDVQGDPRYVVMFGSTPDVVWDPLGVVTSGVSARSALVLAAHDPTLPTTLPMASGTGQGVIEGIFVFPEAGARAIELAEVEAVAGRGLRGDRYFHGIGTWSRSERTGQAVTLVEAEALEHLAEHTGIRLEPGESRRNLLTRGVDLNALVGRYFWVGTVECYGQRWCEPCARLQQLTQPGVLHGLIHRGGLLADIVRGGSIQVGDQLQMKI